MSIFLMRAVLLAPRIRTEGRDGDQGHEGHEGDQGHERKAIKGYGRRMDEGFAEQWRMGLERGLNSKG